MRILTTRIMEHKVNKNKANCKYLMSSRLQLIIITKELQFKLYKVFIQLKSLIIILY